MEEIGSFDARVHWSKILERVVSGQEFIITKHGKPVARLSPEISVGDQAARKAILRLKTMRKDTTLNGLNWKLLREKGRI